MSATHIEFRGSIRETARAMGRLASDDAVNQLNIFAQALGHFDAEAGKVTVALEDGGAEDITDYLAREVGKFPKAGESATPNTRFTGLTAAAASVVERIRRQDDADADAHAKALANGPNPWTTGNQTHQVIVNKRLPQLAAQLKAQAGK